MGQNEKRPINSSGPPLDHRHRCKLIRLDSDQGRVRLATTFARKWPFAIALALMWINSLLWKGVDGRDDHPAHNKTAEQQLEQHRVRAVALHNCFIVCSSL